MHIGCIYIRRTKIIKPILKWAGGKTQLLDQLARIISNYDTKGKTFFEPFVGGGSVFLSYEFPKVVINDYNEDLINTYVTVRDTPNELIDQLRIHASNNTKEYYYAVREMDREETYNELSNVEKAARMIYLNRTCYNGLYRVNSKGQFNVPYGRYTNPDIVQSERIQKMSDYLNNCTVEIMNGDFEDCTKSAKKGDIIYFDPPYDYEENGFAEYTKDSFSRKDLVRLKELAERLLNKGCHVVISNNDTSFVRELFIDNRYKIESVIAHRMINSKVDGRKAAKEVIIHD